MRLVYDLFKLRIGIVIAITALVGVAIQPGPAPAGWRIAILGLAVLVSSAAAGAFNQYYEAALDARMARTRNRPFVTGTLSRHWGWLALIVAMCIVSVVLAWWATNLAAAAYTFAGAFVYAIVYTVWLKRRTWWNIVVGGLAGSFAVLAGAAAVAPGLSAEALVFAVVLFLWTPPHFWSLAIAYRADYAAAGVPMLPVVKGDAAAARAILANAVMLVLASLVPMLLGAGLVYSACAAAGGAYFIVTASRLAALPDRKNAMRCFHASLMQLSLVLVGGFVDAALVR